MWSQSTRLVREGALGPLSFAMKDSIQSNQRTFKQNSYWLIGVSYNNMNLLSQVILHLCRHSTVNIIIQNTPQRMRHSGSWGGRKRNL